MIGIANSASDLNPCNLPLSELAEAVGVTPGRDRPIHFFELPGETVWGATARILKQFLDIVDGREDAE